MTFNTKKWLFFITTIITFLSIFLIFHFFVSSNNLYFRIQLNILHNNSNDGIILNVSSQQALKVQNDLNQEFKTIYTMFKRENFLEYISSLSSNHSVFINFEEYNFINYFFNLVSETKGLNIFTTSSNCATNQISFIACIAKLPSLIEIHKNDSLDTPYYKYSLIKRREFSLNKEEFNFIYDTYIINKIRDYLLKNNVNYFIIHLGNITLVQEQKTNKGWALQYGKKLTELYYIYNQMIYADQKLNQPNLFAIQNVDPFKTSFPLLEFWHKYWVKTHPEDKDNPFLQKVNTTTPIKTVAPVKLTIEATQED